MDNPLPKIPNPWKILREDLAQVMEKESRVVLPKRWMRVARFILLAYRKFDEERCFMRAAALSFNSLLALIPVLALATVLTGWLVGEPSSKGAADANATAPAQQFVSKIIVSVLPAKHEDPEKEAKIAEIRDGLRDNISDFTNNLAQQVSFDKTGVLSALVFVYLGLMVVMQLEDTFNDLWAVRRSRVWYSQLLKFSPGLVLGPGCIILAFALANAVHFENISDRLQSMGAVVNTLVPLLFAMAGLTFLYKLIPNTKVSWTAAIWGGVVAGILWQINHLASALYISHVVVEKGWYSQTYGGSLGLLPVFMLAVYFTWLILLYGALVAARVQYHTTPLKESVEDKDAEPEKPEPGEREGDDTQTAGETNEAEK
ncbi:MAG: YihY/virulence factor BrkB family protein [Verrucomicrobia subdivision 3 bacterium]|nr:YihY/virulence factor BrkB family protein [Limisphaerales bacterium]